MTFSTDSIRVQGLNGGKKTAALTKRHKMSILMPQNAKRNKQIIDQQLKNVNPGHSMSLLIELKKVSILLILRQKKPKHFSFFMLMFLILQGSNIYMLITVPCRL